MSVERTLLVVALCVSTLLLIIALILVLQLRSQRRHNRELSEAMGALTFRVQSISQIPAVARSLYSANRVALVLNPVKLRSDEARRAVQAAAEAAGLPPVEVFETTEDDAGESMTLQALESGASVVVAAGGDGTVRQVAKVLAGTGVALGILPLGTGNLLARNLDLPINNLDQCVDIAVRGQSRDIDTVAIRLKRVDGSELRTVFTVIAGVGYDADIMGDTRDDLKEWAGWLAYGEAGMRHLPGTRKEISLSLDGGPLRKYQVRSVMIANVGLLTGGINFIPQAVIDDGLLDVVLLSPRHVVDWIRIAGKTLLKLKRKLPGLESHQATQCRIVLHEPIISQLDGDATGEVNEIAARLQPDSLRVQIGTPGS